MAEAPGSIPLHREHVDPLALVRSALEVFTQQAEALGVELRVESDGELLARVELDPEKIAWCVATLVGNSLRYVKRGTRTMPGGWILVRLAQEPGGKNLTIAVHDDGPGMPAGVASRLLERAPGALHASGLALVLIRDVVVAHGGELLMERSTDSVDHGTKITMRLPAT
jgi:signal transduction histidine kinase